ncbi:MAG: hypothetical protein ABIG66_03660 [Candidatus Kerfeldbacteria bacterium]
MIAIIVSLFGCTASRQALRTAADERNNEAAADTAQASAWIVEQEACDEADAPISVEEVESLLAFREEFGLPDFDFLEELVCTRDAQAAGFFDCPEEGYVHVGLGLICTNCTEEDTLYLVVADGEGNPIEIVEGFADDWHFYMHNAEPGVYQLWLVVLPNPNPFLLIEQRWRERDAFMLIRQISLETAGP